MRKAEFSKIFICLSYYFMVLTPHILIGGALGARSKKIYWAFIFGIISHYLLDMLPHWDYLYKMAELFEFTNILKLSVDFILGLLIILFLTRSISKKSLVLIGAGAGILPDALQTLIYFLKINWLHPLSLFHDSIHYPDCISCWQNIPVLIFVFIMTILIIRGVQPKKN